MSKKLLGEILIESGKITQAQLNEALEIKENSHQKIGVILLELGYITKEDLMQVIQVQSSKTIATTNSIMNGITVPDGV